MVACCRWQGQQGPSEVGARGWRVVNAAGAVVPLTHVPWMLLSASLVSLLQLLLPPCLQFLKDPSRAAMGDGFQPRSNVPAEPPQ